MENGDKQWLGDPTEIAVTSIVQNKKNALRLFELPFDGSRKLMTVVVKCDGIYYSVTKGSLESMQDADNYVEFEKQYHVYTKKGLRVLALAVKRVRHDFPRSQALEKQLHISALFTIIDPPRKGSGRSGRNLQKRRHSRGYDNGRQFGNCSGNRAEYRYNVRNRQSG